MKEETFAVDGLTCSHCVHAITEEISAIPGVEHIHIRLVPGGASQLTVTSSTPITSTELTAALDEAGDYRLAS